MNARVKLDHLNRIRIPSELWKAAGIVPGQKLSLSATPGRIVLEIEPTRGRVVKRGRLKVWTGPVPAIPLEEAVELARRYAR